MENEKMKELRQEIRNIFGDELQLSAEQLASANDGEAGLSTEEALKSGELAKGVNLYRRIEALFESKGI